mgnify:CR=1 FL=1
MFRNTLIHRELKDPARLGAVKDQSKFLTPPVRRSSMSRKCSVCGLIAIAAAALLIACMVEPVQAYRICTFKGTVVENGWRSMTVKSNGQCAEVNVGWRTKFVPNRRPCIGEDVAVDFILEDGYMKATKVVSLTPLPASAQCYPPAPPQGTVCRNATDEPGPSGGPSVGPSATDSCTPPKPIVSTRPPAHVSDPSWSPSAPSSSTAPSPSGKRRISAPSTRPESRPPASASEGVSTRRPSAPATPGTPGGPPKKPVGKTATGDKKVIAKTSPVERPAAPKEEVSESAPKEEKSSKTITGEVVASSPKSLSLRVTDDSESAEVVNVRVGLKTKFIPFRRPAVGEKVKIEFRQENGDKFGYTVQVVQ